MSVKCKGRWPSGLSADGAGWIGNKKARIAHRAHRLAYTAVMGNHSLFKYRTYRSDTNDVSGDC